MVEGGMGLCPLFGPSLSILTLLPSSKRIVSAVYSKLRLVLTSNDRTMKAVLAGPSSRVVTLAARNRPQTG
jgi:hypothetical protein